MKHKDIQETRIKGYFIEATKDILKGEGLRAISVRNIADRAGYSYATLYNYFKDVKDLIFECVVDFQDECEQFVHSEISDGDDGLLQRKQITKAYVKFFIQYPGIFELFYIEKPTNNKAELSAILMALDLCNKNNINDKIIIFTDSQCIIYKKRHCSSIAWRKILFIW